MKELKEKDVRKKDSSRMKGVVIAVLLFFGVGASIIMAKQYNEKADIETRAQVDRENMQEDQLALLNEIEQNLAEITAHENLVRINLAEEEPHGPLTSEERIQQEIAIIADLIDQNNALIEDLQGQLNKNNDELASYSDKNKRLEKKLRTFTKRVDELEKLNAQLAADGEELKEMNTKLASDLELKSMENEFLTANFTGQAEVLQAKNNEIQLLSTELNTSYYLVGDYKELKEMDIVEKEGGIIGIGGTKELKDDFDKKQFIPIDKMNYTTIPVFSKKAELATNHPTNSYKWVEGDDGVKYLEITKPAAFWESSKYLVILTDKPFFQSKSA